MKSEQVKISLAFFITCTVWGSTWMFIRYGLNTIPPLFSAGLRFLVALPVLYGYVVWKKIPNPFMQKERWLLIVMGIFSFYFPFAFIYWAEQYVPTGLSSILFAVYPFCVAIFSHLMLKDKPLSVWKILGIVCGFTGVVVIFYDGIFIQNTVTLVGMALIILSAIFQGYVVILIKKYGHDIHPMALNFGAMSVGAPLLLLSSLIVERNSYFGITPMAVFSIFYLAIIGSIFTFASYYWLLKRVEAVFLSLVAFVTPIFAVILGAIFLKEKLEPKTFLGASIVLTGILIANAGSVLNSISQRKHK